MRRVSVLLVAALLWSGPFPLVAPAAAVEGYDAQYSGQSAFLTLAPGASGTFTVFFLNTGTTTWTKGTSTEVHLAACLADKVTCNAQDATESPFNPGTWASTTRYATTAGDSVGPGSIATFSYSVKPPLGTVQGIYRFNGDLVVAGTGAKIRAEGYYQDVRVTAAAERIEVTPETATDELDIAHTVTVAYTNAAGQAIAGIAVDVFVVRDSSPFNSAGECSRAVQALPNFTGQTACKIDSADPVTDSAGKVQFTWSGSVEETHRVVAWTGQLDSVYDTGNSLTQDSATMTWYGTAAGLDIDPEVKTSRFASAYTATAQVEKADGTPLNIEDLPIVWQVVRGGADAGTICSGASYVEVKTVSTDAAGKASFTYTGPADPSNVSGSTTSDCVFAFYDRNGSGIRDSSEPSDAVRVTWSDAAAGSGTTVALSPTMTGLDKSATHTVTIAMRDVFGDPVIGRVVMLQVTRTQVSSAVRTSQGVVLAASPITDISGNASFSYAGPGFGATDTIDACADANSDGDCTDSTDIVYALVPDATVHWTSAAVNSGTTKYLGKVLRCDTAANVIDVYALSGPQTGNLRFSYDLDDQFFLDEDAIADDTINGRARTIAVWEPKCATDDPLVISYVIGGSSQFENEGKTP